MTQQPLNLLDDIESSDVNYSTFWQRFFATIIDGFVLAPFIIIDIFNKTTWKSNSILFASFVITLLYKPFLEGKYGATLGKMAIKLTIVNQEYHKASIDNIIFRNVFDIVNRLLLVILTFITFSSEGFKDVNTLAKYTKFANATTGLNWLTYFFSILALVDAIVLIADNRRQALHDKIGKTLVIQK